MGDKLTTLVDFVPNLWDGLLVTLQLTLGGAVGTVVLAVLLGLGMLAPTGWVSIPCRMIVEFFRGTSLLVQLFWFFYVLPIVLDVDLGPLACGILALALNYGAYSAEVVRSSIVHVPRGQWEGAMALSLSPGRRMFRVIFPQAWALMIPSLATLQIQLLKGTAVASFITLQDLNERVGVLRQATGDTMFSYTVGLLVYFVIAWLIQVGMDALERNAKKRLGRGDGRAGLIARLVGRTDAKAVTA
ncbi:ectoine/hydroxyectoine ABC transporter permease subunit EhuC [Brevibacterium yomogidense]|uniref:ectoine/hydroxyectoine ABC transporter permease subunit EhuC n=1 Tax=Brevibacterium yomogidense TaxID=946573 RepID=UPI0018DF4752|nr:ectoine/hydroxyectoine ABC transporter permease subunit EhuC [Brevibacterium yomogidense]